MDIPSGTAPLDVEVFGLQRDVKRAWLTQGLNALTRHHVDNCAPYARVIASIWPGATDAPDLESLPWLPVRLFKSMDLRSIPASEVAKTLVSSGTSGAAVSRIFLDAETARMQAKALTRIFAQFAGKQRMPMLVVDDDGFLHDRTRFNARAAGILGFSNFGRDHFYLLDAQLRPDWSALDAWLTQHPDQPVFLFGFTFIIWQSLVMAARRDGRSFRLPGGSLLVHGGGWKKMEEQKVDNATFKAGLGEVLGLERVHNFYGMVEQVGSVFFECGEGHLHAPAYADIIVRDPTNLAPAPVGSAGLVQVVSLLPRSYPGHSLLTEDLGVLHGEDDCPCGRLGKHFSVLGRVKNVEIRGCSDTRVVPGS